MDQSMQFLKPDLKWDPILLPLQTITVQMIGGRRAEGSEAKPSLCCRADRRSYGPHFQG